MAAVTGAKGILRRMGLEISKEKERGVIGGVGMDSVDVAKSLTSSLHKPSVEDEESSDGEHDEKDQKGNGMGYLIFKLGAAIIVRWHRWFPLINYQSSVRPGIFKPGGSFRPGGSFISLGISKVFVCLPPPTLSSTFWAMFLISSGKGS